MGKLVPVAHFLKLEDAGGTPWQAAYRSPSVLREVAPNYQMYTDVRTTSITSHTPKAQRPF